MQNIDGALREWFNYGPEHYEMRREQMKEVAARTELTAGCDMLDNSYEDCLMNYRRRYNHQLELVEDQSGEIEMNALVEAEVIAKVVKDFKAKPILNNSPLGHMSLGEIDVGFKFQFGKEIIVLVEVKCPKSEKSSKNLIKKGKSQMVKYCRAFDILVPSSTFVGYVYSHATGYIFVTATDDIPDGFEERLPFLPLE